jgi:Ca-activated chloride channel family protein
MDWKRAFQRSLQEPGLAIDTVRGLARGFYYRVKFKLLGRKVIIGKFFRAKGPLDIRGPGEGTAMCGAVSLSLRVGEPKKPQQQGQQPAAEVTPRAIVLLSDGARDGGRVEPAEAAKLAKERGVPVYSVLVGTADGVVEEELTGGYRRIIRVPPNPETLEQVATTSGGAFFEAPDAEGLSQVYDELGSRLGTREQDREITDVFAALAAALLLAAATFSAVVFKRVP